MANDVHDTIAAIATAAGAAVRGIVRLSGPGVGVCLAGCFSAQDGRPLAFRGTPRRVSGMLQIAATPDAAPIALPGDLYLWPGERSFTRQPAAEFHTIGSAPLLSAALAEFCRHGARVAEPGEFTLRAFLAGRIDLTQAEGVLGIVDARSREDLDDALERVAGGIGRPLVELREQLLWILAELEAGLDFSDEPIEFIARAELQSRLAAAAQTIANARRQLHVRDRAGEAHRVVLTGAANAGKSSLFNALVDRYGDAGGSRSIVSPTPGATRDFVASRLDLDGVPCELVDAAGDGAAFDDLAAAGQGMSRRERRAADVILHCVEAPLLNAPLPPEPHAPPSLLVITKCDLGMAPALALPSEPSAACSSATGAGISELAAAIRQRVAALPVEPRGDAAAARCQGSLDEAARALTAAQQLAASAGNEELLAAEIRAALDAVGVVVGAVCTDDVLDRVFSQFCIGK